MEDNDIVTACKNKLSQFRVKELKDVLTSVGCSKQGKKQDLMDRILALLYDEGTPGLFKNNVNGKDGLVDIINDTYRKMQESGVTDSNAKKQNSSSSSRLKPKEEVEESPIVERKIRCPCGSNLPTGGPLVQCVDPDCNVWQHSNCVIIPEKPMEKIPMPTHFLCEVCRVKRADPFWTTMAYPLYPVKLSSSAIPVDGTNPLQSVEKTFKISRADRELLQKTEYEVQAWCMLFNDSVQFRMQWPQYADLQVNGIPVRTVSRPGSQMLGANGRDDGAKITVYIVEGVNKISLSGSDARFFCFGVRLVRRRTLQQVMGMIPEEPDGELFEDALARVQRCIGGGMTTGNNDSDSDLEVIADSITVNLRCPMSGSRMKTAGRFRACAHMGCFDLTTLVELNERSRKWQCPICLKNYCLEDVIIDPFFNRILTMMQNCGEEIHEIEMKPDGSWRVKKAREVGDLAQWHRPDGSLEVFSSEIVQENVLDCNTSKLGIQNNVVNCHIDGPNGHDDEVNGYNQNIITMSSTSSGQGNEDGNPSVNQDGGGQFDVSNSNENEISSGLRNFSQTHGINDQSSSIPVAQADVIILSDSDDDDVSLVYPIPVPVDSCANHDGFSFSAPEKIADSYPSASLGEGQCVSNKSDCDLLKFQSHFASDSQGGSGFDLFGTSGAMLDEHNSASSSGPVTCMLTSDSTLDPVHHVRDSYDPCSSSLDHQIATANGNFSLEVVLPCPSVPISELPIISSHPGEDWISLKTGETGGEISRYNAEAHHELAVENGLDLQNQLRSEEDSLIQKTNGESGSGPDDTGTGKRSNGPFSFPRHQRSSRKRVFQAAFKNDKSK